MRSSSTAKSFSVTMTTTTRSVISMATSRNLAYLCFLYDVTVSTGVVTLVRKVITNVDCYEWLGGCLVIVTLLRELNPVEHLVKWKNILSSGRTSCQVEHLVKWNILSSGTSCQVEHLVKWNILSSGTSCQVEHLVKWNILSIIHWMEPLVYVGQAELILYLIVVVVYYYSLIVY